MDGVNDQRDYRERGLCPAGRQHGEHGDTWLEELLGVMTPFYVRHVRQN